jgi:DnaJ-class molecular chaperone
MQRITDYYELLGVSRTASEVEIKKSYRRLALRFHPDKNPAPGAAEVFKRVMAAYACLCNPEKRQHYDRFGAAEPQQAPAFDARQWSHAEAADLTPEELFDMFFNGMGHRRQPRTRFFYRRAREDAQSE